MMRNVWRSTVLIMLALSLIVSSAACGQNDDQGKKGEAAPKAQAAKSNAKKIRADAKNEGKEKRLAADQRQVRALSPAMLPLATVDGKSYVQLAELAQLLQFQSDYDAGSKTFLIGDNDAEYEIKADTTVARKSDNPVTLPDAPIMHEGSLYFPVSGLADLFGEDFDFGVDRDHLVVKGNSEAVHEEDIYNDGDVPKERRDELDFGDDPDDPNKDVATGGWLPAEAVPVVALKNIDINEMLHKAHGYLGVKYKFGAKPYPVSHRFDCSSYTRYIYGKYGIHLPRTARAQATRGRTVSRKSLRKGDLLFFYVPGRFKSDKIVGHVGIYIGNNKMINASPKPKNGVQITNINKAYWKMTFLKAKRLAR